MKQLALFGITVGKIRGVIELINNNYDLMDQHWLESFQPLMFVQIEEETKDLLVSVKSGQRGLTVQEIRSFGTAFFIDLHSDFFIPNPDKPEPNRNLFAAFDLFR